jgi:hypothetical protein
MNRRSLFLGGAGLLVGGPAATMPGAFAASASAPARDASGMVSAAGFGTVGDGRADDTKALQAALDATFRNGRQGFLVIPPGTYRVTRPLRIEFEERGRDNVTRLSGLTANGARILSQIDNGQPVLSVVSRAIVRFLLLEGLDIKGDGRESHGLYLEAEKLGTHIYNFCLRDIVVQGCGGDGCRIMGNVFEGQLFNSYFRNNKGNGATFGHSPSRGILSSLHLMGCVFGQNAVHGAAIVNNASDVGFHGCYFLENGRYGLAAGNGCTLLSHCGFENNHDRAGGFASGDAAIDLRTFGTLIGCTGYSIRNQTHLVRGFIANRLVMIGCTGGGAGKAEAAKLARLQGNGNAQATIIGCTGAIDAGSGIDILEIGHRGSGSGYGGRWNSSDLARLGDYRLWVDSKGRLRIKRGMPSADEDGELVGASRA